MPDIYGFIILFSNLIFFFWYSSSTTTLDNEHANVEVKMCANNRHPTYISVGGTTVSLRQPAGLLRICVMNNVKNKCRPHLFPLLQLQKLQRHEFIDACLEYAKHNPNVSILQRLRLFFIPHLQNVRQDSRRRDSCCVGFHSCGRKQRFTLVIMAVQDRKEPMPTPPTAPVLSTTTVEKRQHVS